MKKFILFLMLLTSNAIFASKQFIYTNTAPNPIGTYSQAIRVGNTIYISGQIPIDPKTGELVKGGFIEQVKQSLSNVTEIAKAAGGSIDDIVKFTVFLSDINNFAMLNEEMKARLQQPYPARSVVEVKSIPRNAMVEIEAIMQLDTNTNITACQNDVAQMTYQIKQYGSITSVDGKQFDQVTLVNHGAICSGEGYQNGYHVCTVKWTNGNWGNTLHCN